MAASGSERPRRRRSPVRIYILGALLAAAIVGLVILILATAGGDYSPPSGPVVVPDARPADVPREGHLYGDPDAPVTLAEYLDFQCPFCRRALEEIVPVIEREYVETGIARLEVFPIAFIGDESVQAASAAECANEQDEFFYYHDTLFANQGRENGGAFADSRLKEMAAAIGLDTPSFDSCLDSGKHVAAIEQATQDAIDGGTASTPTFLVDGEVVETSVDAISAAIEQAAGP